MQLTPLQVQQRLFDVHQQLTMASQQVAKARDAEVSAAESLRMAVARCTMAEECPRPKRGENGVTVADRDAWVTQQTAAERQAAIIAEAVCEAAKDNLRVVRDQASVVQSLSALMRAEMSLAGNTGT